jgi:hypothetical protein
VTPVAKQRAERRRAALRSQATDGTRTRTLPFVRGVLYPLSYGRSVSWFTRAVHAGTRQSVACGRLSQ